MCKRHWDVAIYLADTEAHLELLPDERSLDDGKSMAKLKKTAI
jgi:hypothetical protein